MDRHSAFNIIKDYLRRWKRGNISPILQDKWTPENIAYDIQKDILSNRDPFIETEIMEYLILNEEEIKNTPDFRLIHQARDIWEIINK